MKLTPQEYKALSIREFDTAAEKFENNDPSIYNLCRQTGLRLEQFERRKGMRMHCVCRKPG